MRGEKIVNIKAIKDNLNSVKNMTGVKVICVIKADAYGHGAYKVAKALDNEDGYSVATAEEALEIKDATSGKREVFILGKVFYDDYEKCVKNGIGLTVDCEEELLKLEKIASSLSTCAFVHIAVNTGMNRIGVKYDYPLYKLINRANSLKHIEVKGVFSHLYSKDETVSELQKTRFFSAIKDIRFDTDILFHLGATSSIGKREYYFDAVRLGLGLYGYGADDLSPAMSVYGRVSAINLLKSGETVGYGGAFEAKNNEYVATISLGYADGIPRKYSGGEVIINGKKRKIVGNVCMDCCFAVVDEKTKIGDIAVFIGKDGKEKITAEDMSITLDTIPYEILTGFKRIKTAYVD